MHRQQFLLIAFVACGIGLLVQFKTAAAQMFAGKQIRLIVPFPLVDLPTSWHDLSRKCWVMRSNRWSWSTTGQERAERRGRRCGSVEPRRPNLALCHRGHTGDQRCLYKSLPYDALRDFTPIGLVAEAPVAITVNPSAARERSCGSCGTCKAQTRSAQLRHRRQRNSRTPDRRDVQNCAGIDIQHVPYKGGALAQTDLLAGRIQIMFDPMQSTLAQVQAGKLRALAVSAKDRSLALPDIPTIAESGYPDFETTAWWGVFAPANLPADLAAVLATEIEKVVKSEPFHNRMEILGVHPQSLSLSALAEFQRAELKKWGKAVRDSGATAE